MLLLQDNAPIHSAKVAVAEVGNYDFVLSAPYTPDLVHLTSKLKSHLCGYHDEMVWFGLFNGISTIVGYLMPNQILYI